MTSTYTRTYAIVSKHFFKFWASHKARRLERRSTSRSVFARYEIKELETNCGKRWQVVDWGE